MLKTIPAAPRNRNCDSNQQPTDYGPEGTVSRARTAIPSIWHRLRQRRYGGIVRTRAVDDRGQCAWRVERKWCEEANVPFHLAFMLRDFGERPNATRYDIVNPGARLGYGEENRVPGLRFERRLGLGLMQPRRRLSEGAERHRDHEVAVTRQRRASRGKRRSQTGGMAGWPVMGPNPYGCRMLRQRRSTLRADRFSQGPAAAVAGTTFCGGTASGENCLAARPVSSPMMPSPPPPLTWTCGTNLLALVNAAVSTSG
jgi:hypothetical protein